jgi:ABC-type lipoprotein export system ATPase subunit
MKHTKSSVLPETTFKHSAYGILSPLFLINNSALLLVDEPTGSSDAKNEDKLLEILMKLKKEEKMTTLVSYNQKMAKIADRIIHLNHGKISSLREVSIKYRRMIHPQKSCQIKKS